MKLEPLPIQWVTKIFMRLHGRFGNTFFDKYRIGELNESGQDLGIENAKIEWSEQLAGVSGDRISAALASSYDYPPSCDDFKSNCKVKATQQNYAALPAPNNKETNKAYADNVVKFVAAHIVDKTDYKAWAKRIVANPDRFPAESLVAAKEALRA